MAGGTFTAQNKILPGVYINVESQPNAVATVGERGVVAIPKALSWADRHGDGDHARRRHYTLYRISDHGP